MNLFELFVKIGADTTGFESSVKNVKNETSNLGSKLKAGFGVAAKAVGVVTTAAAAAYTGITAAAGSVASYGDSIDKMSQKMGMSAEAYQEWDAVMQHSGTSMETMKASMKTLANAVESGNDAFSKLGLTQEQLSQMSQEEIFEATIAGLQNVTDTTQRTYLAGQLLGRGATELGALLNTSAEETQAMRDRVHELGGVMSDEAVKAAARYQDSLQDMQTSFSGLKNNLIAEFLPGMATVMDGVASLIAGEDGAGATLKQGLDDIIAAMSDSMPQIIDAGVSIVESLSGAIIDNLPEIVKSGVEIIVKLVDSLMNQIPNLADAAISIIETIANSLADNLPTLIPAAVDIVLQVTETLIDNVDKLVSAAISIIDGLAKGLINALPRLIEKAPVIVDKLVKAIIENAPMLLEGAVKIIIALADGMITNMPKLIMQIPAMIRSIVDAFLGFDWSSVGHNIVDGIKNGFLRLWESFKQTVSNMVSGLVSGVKSILGISSPSKVFAGIGGYMAEGLGQGFGREMTGVRKDIEEQMTFGTTSFSVSGAAKSSVGVVNGLLANNQPGALTQVNLVVDGQTLARVLFDPLRGEIMQRGVSLA